MLKKKGLTSITLCPSPIKHYADQQSAIAQGISHELPHNYPILTPCYKLQVSCLLSPWSNLINFFFFCNPPHTLCPRMMHLLKTIKYKSAKTNAVKEICSSCCVSPLDVNFCILQCWIFCTKKEKKWKHTCKHIKVLECNIL